MELNSAVKYRKILVIDDTYIDRVIAEKIIRKFGRAEEVVCLDSAKEALHYLTGLEATPSQLPGIILLDVNMPEMNAFEFLEAYNLLGETIKRNIVIIMLTSSMNVADKDRAMANPYVKRYINKPLNAERIREAEECAMLHFAGHDCKTFWHDSIGCSAHAAAGT